MGAKVPKTNEILSLLESGIFPLSFSVGAVSARRAVLTKKENMILEALQPMAESSGIEVVTVETTSSKKSPVVRVYIDSADGISFNELTSAQSWIGEEMDRIDPFPGAYTLEVSSPGIDRPLRTPEHFQRFVGDVAKVRTAEKLGSRSNFKGEILDADDEGVRLDVDGDVFDIPYRNISKANLVGNVDFKK